MPVTMLVTRHGCWKELMSFESLSAGQRWCEQHGYKCENPSLSMPHCCFNPVVFKVHRHYAVDRMVFNSKYDGVRYCEQMGYDYEVCDH
jgi:hypothetical protein